MPSSCLIYHLISLYISLIHIYYSLIGGGYNIKFSKNQMTWKIRKINEASLLVEEFSTFI